METEMEMICVCAVRSALAVDSLGAGETVQRDREYSREPFDPVCEELPTVLPATRQIAYPIDLTATDSEGSADDSDSDVILELSDDDSTFEQHQ